MLFYVTGYPKKQAQLLRYHDYSVSVCYVAVRTIVLSRHGSNLTVHIVDFLGSAPTSIEVLLRPTQSQSDEPSELRGSLSPTTRHRCPSVYGTWQSQAVTHPIMNRARRCLTFVIKPTPMRQRRIPYILGYRLLGYRYP